MGRGGGLLCAALGLVPCLLPLCLEPCAPTAITVDNAGEQQGNPIVHHSGAMTNMANILYIVLLETLFAELTACYACEKQG